MITITAATKRITLEIGVTLYTAQEIHDAWETWAADPLNAAAADAFTVADVAAAPVFTLYCSMSQLRAELTTA